MHFHTVVHVYTEARDRRIAYSVPIPDISVRTGPAGVNGSAVFQRELGIVRGPVSKPGEEHRRGVSESIQVRVGPDLVSRVRAKVRVVPNASHVQTGRGPGTDAAKWTEKVSRGKAKKTHV